MHISLNEDVFLAISHVLESEGVRGYVIGGYVRDRVMGRVSGGRDIDILVIGDGIDIARKVARHLGLKQKVSVFKNFGTAMFKHDGTEIEFVGARKESYSSESRKPVIAEGSLQDDQNRRDFTINALAISLNHDDFGHLTDPFGGLDDISKGIIRTPLDSDITFFDDPLRMLRAVRFATRLGFTIEKQTLKAISRNKNRIGIVSFERISAELNKIIESSRPSTGFRLLDSTGLLRIILPELDALKGTDIVDDKGHKDNFLHTLEVLDNISCKSDNIWLRWAVLLHDIAKPRTKKYDPETGWTFHGHDYLGAKMVPDIFSRLRLPLNDKMRYVQKLVSLHLRPIALSQDEVTDSAVRRLLFEAGDDIDDLMMLCEADITSKNPVKVKKHLDNFALVRKKLKDLEESDALRNFKPPVDGIEIMETFGIGPGKEVGIIKNAIREAILDGMIRNDHNEAREYMLDFANSLGLKLRRDQ